ncbi:MAG TPA: hypothetical protein VFE58_12600 [Tepidisphaeraceae bacterium]|jgi:hypothetical protein|nr:hypothetical protein [Tepidisphaeraceae bacterium]
MNPEPQNDFDSALEKHFSSYLDSQLGRSARAFAQHLQTNPNHRSRWLIIASTLSAAAMIAFAFFPRHTMPRSAVHPVVTAAEGTIEQVVWSRTLDGGTVFLDGGIPAHKIIRQQLHEMSWTDSTGAKHIRSVTPQTDIMLISLDKY